MKKTLFFLILTCILQSCIKEEETHTFVKLKNTTQHGVSIFPFSHNLLDSSKIIILNFKDEFEMERTFHRGKSSKPIFWGDYFINVDSVQVWWDDTYCVTHMVSGDYTSQGKFIEYGGEKNLTHPNLYEVIKQNETKHSIRWLMIHNFTEDDYNYAKD